MHEKNVTLYELFSLLYVLILVIITCIFSVINDNLLFKSDIGSLIHFFLGLSILSFIPPAILLSVAYVLLSKRLIKKLTLLFVGSFLGLIFFTFSFNFVATAYGPFHELTEYSKWFFGLLIFSLVIIPLLLNLNLSRPLLSNVAQITFPTCIAVFLYFAMPNYWQRLVGDSGGKKNVVMLVLDGFGTYQLPVYNPKESGTPETNDFLNQGLLFKNIYTNFTYTTGYFSTFYSGAKCYESIKNDANYNIEGRTNILETLQKHGINTRWSTMHPSGIPEATTINAYKGLRSNYLNHQISKLAYLMGLDYNVYRFTGTRKNDSPLVKLIYNAIKYKENEYSDMKSYFEYEVSKLHSDNRPFFLLIHTKYDAEANWQLRLDERQAELWEDHNKLLKEQKEILEYIDKNEYTYRKSDELVIRSMADQTRTVQNLALANIVKSMQVFLEDNGWDKDTILLVTSDHGKIFRKGRVYSGYHNDEDVTKVLMLVYNTGKKGVDEKLRETIDLTQTVFDLFDIEEKIHPNAISLFDDKQKHVVSSLTLPSNTWFLNLYLETDKSILKAERDLYRSYNNTALYKVTNFDTLPVQSVTPDTDKIITKSVADALRQYCLDPSNIKTLPPHPLNRNFN